MRKFKTQEIPARSFEVGLSTVERVRKRFVELGQVIPAPDRLTPEALGAYQRAEIEKWWPIIKAAGITAQ